MADIDPSLNDSSDSDNELAIVNDTTKIKKVKKRNKKKNKNKDKYIIKQAEKLEYGLIAVASSNLEPGIIKNIELCVNCNYCRTCSKECYNNTNKYHSSICSVLQNINIITKHSDCDIDLLRIIIELIGKIIVEGHTNLPSNLPGVLSLVSNIEHMSQAWQNSILIGAKLIFDNLKQEDQVLLTELTSKEKLNPLEFMLGLAARVNSNAHGLGDVHHGQNTNIAFGLFPNASRLNHSCRPNCNFIGTFGGKLHLINIKKVSSGEELTVRYVDLYQQREGRKLDLQNQKHFNCECLECSRDINDSPDKYLSGFLCDNSNCKKKQINISNNSSIIIPKYLLLKSQKNDNFAYDANLDLSYNSSNWRCDLCNKFSTDNDMDNLLKMAEKEYNAAMYAKESKQYLKAKEMFENLVNKYEFKLHPLHTLMVNSLTPLVNLSNFLKDYKCAIKSAKKLIACYDIVYQENYPETADYLFYLAEIFTNCINESGKSIITKHYVKEREEVLKRCINMRSICCGKDHCLALYTIEYLNSFNN